MVSYGWSDLKDERKTYLGRSVSSARVIPMRVSKNSTRGRFAELFRWRPGGPPTPLRATTEELGTQATPAMPGKLPTTPATRSSCAAALPGSGVCPGETPRRRTRARHGSGPSRPTPSEFAGSPAARSPAQSSPSLLLAVVEYPDASFGRRSLHRCAPLCFSNHLVLMLGKI